MFRNGNTFFKRKISMLFKKTYPQGESGFFFQFLFFSSNLGIFFSLISALDLPRKWKTHGLMNPSGNSGNKFLYK